MDISNTGGSFAIYNATLFIDGKIVGSKTALINPGDVKTVSFTITLKNEGDHTVRLCNKTSIIHVRANAPASFEITDLSINPSTVKVGDYVTISVDVKNIGGSSGNYTVTLKVNGKIEDVKNVTLDSGESTTVTFKYTVDTQGTLSVDVNGITKTFTANSESPSQPSQNVNQGRISTTLVGVIVALVVAITAVVIYYMRIKSSRYFSYFLLQGS